jgi:phosphoglycolate phosphatase
MKKYRYIFWDLDGTLSDSALGIVNAAVYALGRMGTEFADREMLKKLVGPPLSESFEKYFGYTPEQTGRAVALFRAYYQEKGIYENTMYPGIEALLGKLRDNGQISVVATSKPEPHARAILKRYGIDRYFQHIAGSTLDNMRTHKEEVIAYALASCGITDSSEAVMVGDRAHDAIGAKLNGMDCIGVLYGYGERGELIENGVVALAADIGELGRILLAK